MRFFGLAGLLVPGLVSTLACGPGGHDHQNNNNDTQPLTVVVDTGQTMTAAPGQGVGVFIEYRAGGHWHVWWACDTSISGMPCDDSVIITGTSIANAQSGQFADNDALDTSTPNQLTATTHTTTGISSVDFDATPSATITVDASVSGLRDGKFFFWVQGGNIDGNYQGPLTDPLIFEPSSP